MSKKLYSRVVLFLAVFASILPFLNQRVLRMAGDEKVYLSTAVEMHRAGNWFVQTLADEPNYFKGPFHYIFTRLGFFVFGDQLIAGLWINLVLAFLSGLALLKLTEKKWGTAPALTLAVAGALNVGVVSHVYASQMEVEVFAFYTFAMAFLGLSIKDNLSETFDWKNFTLFWISAGVAGWIKSPVHSVLIVVSGMFYLMLRGVFFELFFTGRFWKCASLGIFAGILGYLPIVLQDGHNFYSTYILREQFEKANNNRQWHYVVAPLIHFLLPWTFVVLFGIFSYIKNKISPKLSFEKKYDSEYLKLGFAFSLPTILFWSTWSYKGQNYNLPTLSALLLLGWSFYRGRVPKNLLRLSGVLGLIVFFASIGILTRFWPLPAWWPNWMAISGAVFVLIFALLFLQPFHELVVTIGATAFFIAFGLFITPLGKRETIDIKQFISDHPTLTYNYYNIDRSIWNEWGLFQLTFHIPFYGIHRPEKLDEVLMTKKQAIFIQNRETLDKVVSRLKEIRPEAKAEITLCSRWLTKGKSANGENKFKSAWEKRSLTEVEKELYILELK